MENSPPPPLADTIFIRRCFRMERRETAFLRFLVEGYEGLLFMRTLDGGAALVEIAYAPSWRRDAEGVVAALAVETGLVEVDPPPPSPL